MNTEKIGWTNLEKLHPFFKQWSTVWKTKYTGNRKINYRFTNEYVQLAIRVTEERRKTFHLCLSPHALVTLSSSNYHSSGWKEIEHEGNKSGTGHVGNANEA